MSYADKASTALCVDTDIHRGNMHTLADLLIVLTLAVGVILACHRIKIPPIVGFLITGCLAGPYGLGLVKTSEDVNFLAELGVVLLLFSIGLEFSLSELVRIRRIVLLGGGLQVLITTAVVWALVTFAFRGGSFSLPMGFMLALSSTAIVLKTLQDRMELESAHGQMCLGILLFQDVAVVPMMLLIPLLGGSGENLSRAVGILALKSAGIFLFVFLTQRYVLPRVLHIVAATRSREVFLLTAVVFCFGVAWITSSAGLSLSLGAFLAGLVLSESEYSHQTLAQMLPFKDLFTSLFFVSVGMTLNLSFVVHHWVTVVSLTLLAMAIKAIVCLLVVLILGYPLRTAVHTGLILAQIGEFSFVLCTVCIAHGILVGEHVPLFLAVSTVTMMVTPFLAAVAPRAAERASRWPLPQKVLLGFSSPSLKKENQTLPPLTNHLIIVGYGPVGRNLARAAKSAGIPYAVVEMNPATVKQEKKKGEPIVFGDASEGTLLEHVSVKEAKVVCVSLADPATVRRITAAVRAVAPAVYLIVRTRFLSEVRKLTALGANEVIPEELETSIEIFARVLTKYLVPREEIEQLIARVRLDGYQSVEGEPIPAIQWCDILSDVPDMEVRSTRVTPGSLLAEKTIGELNLRKNWGVTVLAVRRDGQWRPNPGPDLRLKPGDVVILLGRTNDLIKFYPRLMAPTSAAKG